MSDASFSQAACRRRLGERRARYWSVRHHAGLERTPSVATVVRFCFFGVYLFVLALGCAAKPEAKSKRPSLLSGLVAPPAFVSPGRWEYHPPKLDSRIWQRAEVEGGSLLVTDEGERWLVDEDGQAQVATMLAPEPLVGFLQLDQGNWLFVGASGATYEARSPLGAFVRTALPDVALVRVAVSKSTLLGVTRQGQLMRSAAGSMRWEETPQPSRVADVAVLESGHALALLVPEQLMGSKDFGKTWKPLSDGDRFGAIDLERTDDGILVRGVLESRLYTPESAQPWSAPRPARKRGPQPDLAIALRPSANALLAGRATLAGSNYYELSREDSHWQLRSGPEFGSLSERAVPTFEQCRTLSLAGYADVLHVLCAEASEGRGNETRWFVSEDAGKSWHSEPLALRADFAELVMVVAGDGSLVAYGLCASEAVAGCAPDGVYRIARVDGDGGRKWERKRLNLPLLRGLPFSMAVTHDGKRIVIVGTQAKSKGVVVYSGGASQLDFSTEEIPELVVATGQSNGRGPVLRQSSLRAGADGQLSMSLRVVSTQFDRVLVVDRQGRLVSLGSAPSETASVQSAGLYAIAYEPGGQAWESVDGGVNWDAIGNTPAPVCPADEKVCDAPVVCWARGCLFGERFSRIGWRGQEDVVQGNLSHVADLSAGRGDELLTPIRCRFDEQRQWQRLPAVHLPDASQAQLGGVEWFAYYADWRTGSAGMHEAVELPEPQIESFELFSDHNSPAMAALHASLQVEGMVALRVERGVAQLAWRNLLEGRTTHKVRLPNELHLPQRTTSSVAKLAEPEVASISRNGVYVRVARNGQTAPAYYVEPNRTTKLPEFAWPSLDARARGEMIHADGSALALSIVEAGAAIVRMRQVDGGWRRDAVAMGLLNPQSFDLDQGFDLAYQGNRPGFHIMFLEARPSQSWWFPFQSGEQLFGEAVAVPSQADLGAQPTLCSPGRMQSTPRVIAPRETATRHPVVITHTAEPWSGLVTDKAVLYGTPKQPCLGAFDAASPGNNDVSALVLPDSSRSSWLFRKDSTASAFEVRRMTCQFDPAMEIPAELRAASN